MGGLGSAADPRGSAPIFALGLVLVSLWCETRLGLLKTDPCVLEGTFEEEWGVVFFQCQKTANLIALYSTILYYTMLCCAILSYSLWTVHPKQT